MLNAKLDCILRLPTSLTMTAVAKRIENQRAFGAA